MGNKVIKAKKVLTMDEDNSIIDDAMVIIEDSIITYVGKYDKTKLPQKYTLINRSSSLVTPGFINSHTHIAMSIFKTLADDEDDRLRSVIFPLENSMLSSGLVYASSLNSCHELIEGGVTTIADMYYFGNSTAKAVQESGLRALVGESITSFKVADSTCAKESLEIAKDLLDNYKDNKLIIPSLAPHAPYSINKEDALLVSKFSREYNMPILSHLAEMPFENDAIIDKYSLRPTEYYEKVGFLDNACMAHCINVNLNDIDILKKHNTGIAHNPAANSKAGKGIAPVKQMIESNLKLGIGTDGSMSGNTQDTLALLRWVSNLQRIKYSDRTIIDSVQVMRNATIEGAKALKLDTITGSIEVGKQADIISFDLNNSRMYPSFNPYASIIYNARTCDINLTMVAGRVLKDGLKLKTLDYDKIQDQIKPYLEKIYRDYKKFIL